MATDNRNRNLEREESSNMPWIIGAVIAIAAVIGIVSYGGNGTNVASNDNAPSATSAATTGSATTGSGSAETAPRAPLPAGPRR